jgi:hypothetical protein
MGEVAGLIAQRFPRAALVDDAGRLTEDGVEVVAQTGVEPNSLIAAYRRPAGRLPTAANENADAPATADSARPPASPGPMPKLPHKLVRFRWCAVMTDGITL